MFSSSQNLVIYGGSFHDSHSLSQGGTSNHTSGFERLLQAASPSAFYNSGERFDPPRCHPKTRLKVLEDISNWIDGTDDHHHTPVMWVNGGAGVGKSAIAQTMAERLAEKGRLLASYFFSRTDPSRNNANHLVASIAYQSVLYIPQIKEHIINAVERNPLVFKLSLEAQFSSLITIPFRELGQSESITSSPTPLIIVIDGLDECNDRRSQVQVLNSIASALRNGPSPFAFLILSRHEQDLSMAFSSGHMAQFHSSLRLDDIYADDDIRFFLEDQFEELKNSHPLRAHLAPSWPLPEHIDMLVRKSSGQFIYASTVVKYISSVRHRPDKRLEVILGLRLVDKENPFAELDALYTHILSSVETEKICMVLDILAFYIMTWEFYSIAHAEKFLELDPGDIESSLWDLGSIVQVKDSSVRVLHASLHDFLFQESRSRMFHIHAPIRHDAYARRYLEILRTHSDVWLSSLVFYHLGEHCRNAHLTPELEKEILDFSFTTLRTNFCRDDEKRDVFLDFIPEFSSALESHPSLSEHIQRKSDEYFAAHVNAYYADPQHTFLITLVGIKATCIDDYLAIGLFEETYEPLFYLSYYRPFYDYSHPLDEQHLDIRHFLARPHFARFSGNVHPYRDQLYDFLRNPLRSGSTALNSKRYAIAALHCLKFLCEDDGSFIPFTEYNAYEINMRTSRPLFWRKVLRLRTRRLMSFQAKVLKRTKGGISGNAFPDMEDLLDDFLYSQAYRWALQCFRQLLRRSSNSKELLDFASRRSLSIRSLDWPRQSRLTRNAIDRYIASCHAEDNAKLE